MITVYHSCYTSSLIAYDKISNKWKVLLSVLDAIFSEFAHYICQEFNMYAAKIKACNSALL